MSLNSAVPTTRTHTGPGVSTHVPGIAFFLLNVWYSYYFYHVNTYKLFVLGVISCLMLLIFTVIKPLAEDLMSGAKLVILLALPVVITVPGMLMTNMTYNYYFPIEFSSKVFLILWAFSLFLCIRMSGQRDTFIRWIAFTILYVSVYAILERYGLNPAEPEFNTGSGVDRVKSTFGNINYFAGFLITVSPLILFPFIGKILSDYKSEAQNASGRISRLTKATIKTIVMYPLHSIAIICSVFALAFTQTRAAQAGGIFSVVLCLSLFILGYLTRGQRKVFYGLIIFGFASAGLLIYLGVHYSEELFNYLGAENRYAKLFTREGWYPRLVPWMVAWRSIMEAPLFGYGLGSSYSLFFKFVPSEVDLYHNEKSFNHVHNEHLEFIQEAGFIGYILLIAVLAHFIVHLFRISRNKEVSLDIRLLSLACIAGITAFYFHGIFDVTQRMIVALFGFYTVLGIAFWIIAGYGSPFKTESFLIKTAQLIYRRSVLYAVIFIPLIVYSWVLFYQWVIPFVRAGNFHREPAKTIALFDAYSEESRRDPSVYVLYDIADQELNFRRFAQAAETGKTILELIPHYRNTEFTTALAYLGMGNIQEAVKYITLYKEHADYDSAKNLLQGYLGLRAADPKLFEDALKNFFIRNLFNQVYMIRDYHNIGLTMTAPNRVSISQDLINVQLSRQGNPFDYKTASADLCNTKPQDITGAQFTADGTVYELMREAVAQNNPGIIHFQRQKIIEMLYLAEQEKISRYSPQLCPELSNAEQTEISSKIRQLIEKFTVFSRLNYERRLIILNASAGQDPNIKLRQILGEMDNQLKQILTEINALKAGTEKSNYGFFEAEMRMLDIFVIFSDSVLAEILRFAVVTLTAFSITSLIDLRNAYAQEKFKERFLKKIETMPKREIDGRVLVDTTLRELVIFSILASSQLENSLNDLKKAKAGIQSAAGSFDPRLNISASTTKSNSVTSTPADKETIGIGERTVSGAEIGIKQKIPLGITYGISYGKYENKSATSTRNADSYDQTTKSLNPDYYSDTVKFDLGIPLFRLGNGNKSDVNIAVANSEKQFYANLAVIDQIVTLMGGLYYDFYGYYKQYDAQKKRLAYSTRLYDETRTRFEMGSADLLKLKETESLKELDIQNLKSVLFQIIAFEDQIKQALKLQEIPYGIYPTDAPEITEEANDRQILIQRAYENDSLLKQYEKDSSINEYRRESIEDNDAPDVNLNLNYTLNGYGYTTDKSNGHLSGNKTNGYTVALTWNIPLGNNTGEALVYQNLVEGQQAANRQSTRRSDIELSITQNLKNLDLLAEERKTRETTVSLAGGVLEREQEKNRLGSGSVINILQAQNNLQDAEKNLTLTLVNYAKKTLQLDTLTGDIYQKLQFDPRNLFTQTPAQIADTLLPE
ncbi:hypothetical protein CHS0354_027419 [Potamilus streckersoni]|uniref:O-antigen ligase-related domain-containing protein n=1 Tax=Potamilus streckersoni TaxID=2493646 RepID=A0AAE0SQX5_9BIVA|nr:hypothetical protein CHS0354_027419 [Potamilus streckersoni]